MSEIASVGSVVPAALGSVGANPNINASGAPSGEISSSSAQVALSSQFSQTSILASNYSSGSIALSEFGNKMMAIILALIDFLYGNKDDENKKQIGLMALMALIGSSQTQSSSYLQFSQYSVTSQSSISNTQMVLSSAASSAYNQGGPAYAGGETISAVGDTIDTSA